MQENQPSVEKRAAACLRRFHRAGGTEKSRQRLFRDLASIVLTECKTEIDSAVRRLVSQSTLPILCSLSSGIWTQTDDPPAQLAQRPLRNAVNLIAFSVQFKSLRNRLLHTCRRLTSLRSFSSYPPRNSCSSFSADSTDGTLFALSTLSLGQSFSPAMAIDLNQLAVLLSDPTVVLAQRLAALDRLLEFTSFLFARSTAAKTVVHSLWATLIVPQLFDRVMQLAVRILSAADGAFRSEIVGCLILTIPTVMRNESLTSTHKLRFSDLILQIFRQRSPVSRRLTEILTLDPQLLRFLGLLDPAASWFQIQTHSFLQRLKNQSAILEFARRISTNEFSASTTLRCFGYCSILIVISYGDLLNEMEESVRTQIADFLTLETPKLLTEKRPGIRRVCSLGLLETLSHQTAVSFFAENEEILRSLLRTTRRNFALRAMAKVIHYVQLSSTLFPEVIGLLQRGIKGTSRIAFAVTVDFLQILIRQSEVVNKLTDEVDFKQLVLRLDPKLPAHARLLKTIEKIRK